MSISSKISYIKTILFIRHTYGNVHTQFTYPSELYDMLNGVDIPFKTVYKIVCLRSENLLFEKSSSYSSTSREFINNGEYYLYYTYSDILKIYRTHKSKINKFIRLNISDSQLISELNKVFGL